MHNISAIESHGVRVIWDREGHFVPSFAFMKDVFTRIQIRHIPLQHTQLFSRMFWGAWQVPKRLNAFSLGHFFPHFYLICLFLLPNSLFPWIRSYRFALFLGIRIKLEVTTRCFSAFRISKQKVSNYISKEKALKQVLAASKWSQRLIAHVVQNCPTILTGQEVGSLSKLLHWPTLQLFLSLINIVAI